jgi:hypothetical protein
LQTAPSDPPYPVRKLLEIKKESAPHLSMIGALSLRKLLCAALINLSKSLLELSYPAASIKNSLLTGIEGVAYRTNFNIN